MKRWIFAPAALALLASCAHRHTTPSATVGDTTPQARGIATQQNAETVTEISFEKGRKELTPAARSKIEKLLREAGGPKVVEEIKVITWADKEFPSDKTKTLSKAQRDLADARNHEISSYIASLDRHYDVDTYNMAERANAFERLMSTSDARVKRQLEIAGIPKTGEKRAPQNVRVPSKAGKSIVMIMLEERD